jgi:hypothetical protein
MVSEARGRALSVGAMITGVALLLLTVVGGIVRGRSEAGRQQDRSLAQQALARSDALTAFFDRGRSLTLLLAQNPAFVHYYGTRGTPALGLPPSAATVGEVNAALAYLEQL